jgi:hypothetical protein
MTAGAHTKATAGLTLLLLLLLLLPAGCQIPTVLY